MSRTNSTRPTRRTSAIVEPLENRTFFSAAPQAYPPDAVIAGRSMSQWTANYWTQVLQTKTFDKSGADLNPMVFDDAPTNQGFAGPVFYLFGTFLGGQHTRTATLPAGVPVFIPILPIEFDNFNTTTDNSGTTLPGINTAGALSTFAAQAADPALPSNGGTLNLTVDGQPLAHPEAYQQVAPTFSYHLAQAGNVIQFFFNQDNLKGKVDPAEADGFYAMLKPLAPGSHTIEFGGTTQGGSLGPLNVDMTYNVTVLSPSESIFSQSQITKPASALTTPQPDQPDWLAPLFA